MPGPGTWSAGDILTAADLNAVGTWETYTPVVTQNGVRTATVNYASYVQINKLVVLVVDLEVTAAGSAGSAIQVSVPVTAVAGTGRGCGIFYDASLTDVQLTTTFLAFTTDVRFLVEASTNQTDGLGNNPSVALASGDILSFYMVYQAA